MPDKTPDNLSKEERSALQSLKNGDDIVIKTADKGSTVVVLDKETYMAEAQRQLSDERFYKKLDSDPTKEFSTAITKTLDDMFEKNEIENLPSYLKDTTDYINKTPSTGLPDHTLLMTMDVTSLYTNIPHDEGIEACREVWDSRSIQIPSTESLAKLLEHKETSVQYNYTDCKSLHVESLLQCASLSKESKSVTFFHVPSTKFCHWDCTIIYCPFWSEKLTKIQSVRNAALGQFAHSSSTFPYDSHSFRAGWAVDGKVANLSSHQCFISYYEENPWIQIHLGGNYFVSFIRVHNRQDGFGERLHDLTFWVFQGAYNFTACGFFKGPGLTKQVVEILCEDTLPRNIVRLQITYGSYNSLALCEVEVHISA
ncbi:uncharacterized protein LOC134247840 [Saccostrea cucullata]|uniref:uncharacterized protein LOC134247840 n=1 Tax=Saccostrea cuccullata TaxID=36930 RepID=UPI002ED15D73